MPGDTEKADPVNYEAVDEDEEYELPANAGFSDYIAHPHKTFQNYMQRFFNNFGWRFAIQLTVM